MTEKITYNKKEYPVKVGYYALKHTAAEIKETQGREIKMLDIMSDDITVLEPLLFYSMVLGARLEGKTFDMKREEAEFVLDECLPEFIKIVPKFFKTAFANEETKTEQPTESVDEKK